MKDLLRKKGYTIRDSSINSSTPNNAQSPEYIKSEILAPRITQAGTFLVLISRGTKQSEWVDWEIEYAARLGKRIVGVWEHGASEADVPEPLTKYALRRRQLEHRSDHGCHGRPHNWEKAMDRRPSPSRCHVTDARPTQAMRVFSYVVARDFGFAPNPFFGFCTLATCKPRIRSAARVGDWVVGTGSARHGYAGRAVFLMKIAERIGYDDYWSALRFWIKRPVLTGSIKQAFGDNIYHRNSPGDPWQQENSHHSLSDGSPNPGNVAHDTAYPWVLLANDFSYFGRRRSQFPIVSDSSATRSLRTRV